MENKIEMLKKDFEEYYKYCKETEKCIEKLKKKLQKAYGNEAKKIMGKIGGLRSAMHKKQVKLHFIYNVIALEQNPKIKQLFANKGLECVFTGYFVMQYAKLFFNYKPNKKLIYKYFSNPNTNTNYIKIEKIFEEITVKYQAEEFKIEKFFDKNEIENKELQLMFLTKTAENNVKNKRQVKAKKIIKMQKI